MRTHTHTHTIGDEYVYKCIHTHTQLERRIGAGMHIICGCSHAQTMFDFHCSLFRAQNVIDFHCYNKSNFIQFDWAP